jgi:large subunit ribosomal protein L37Ae
MVKKKLGSSSARFGARYGRTLRKKVGEIEKRWKQWHKCPYCRKKKVKRMVIGIWHCKSCNSKFTGRAYGV